MFVDQIGILYVLYFTHIKIRVGGNVIAINYKSAKTGAGSF